MRIDSRMNIKWEVMAVNWVVDVQRFIITLRKKREPFRCSRIATKKLRRLFRAFNILRAVTGLYVQTWCDSCFFSLLGTILISAGADVDEWFINELFPNTFRCSFIVKNQSGQGTTKGLAMYHRPTAWNLHTRFCYFTTISRAAFPLLAQFLDFSVFSFLPHALALSLFLPFRFHRSRASVSFQHWCC